MIKYHYIIFFIFIISKLSYAQTEISWKDLEDVEFSDVYFEEEEENFLYPHFGMSVKQLEGQEVILSGYILAMDPLEGYYVLSKGPFSSCFFCGGAGPETIVELNLNSDQSYFKMDEFVTMIGILKLNSDDIYHCNYIFQNAEVYSR